VSVQLRNLRRDPRQRARCAVSGYPVVKFRNTDVGFLRSLPPPVFLEKDKGPDDDVLAASRVGGAVGSIQAVWKDQRETEPSVTES